MDEHYTNLPASKAYSTVNREVDFNHLYEPRQNPLFIVDEEDN